jgi:hypothetical protein
MGAIKNKFSNECSIRNYLTRIAQLEVAYGLATANEYAANENPNRRFSKSKGIRKQIEYEVREAWKTQGRYNRSDGPIILTMLQDIIDSESCFVEAKKILEKVMERSSSAKVNLGIEYSDSKIELSAAMAGLTVEQFKTAIEQARTFDERLKTGDVAENFTPFYGPDVSCIHEPNSNTAPIVEWTPEQQAEFDAEQDKKNMKEREAIVLFYEEKIAYFALHGNHKVARNLAEAVEKMKTAPNKSTMDDPNKFSIAYTNARDIVMDAEIAESDALDEKKIKKSLQSKASSEAVAKVQQQPKAEKDISEMSFKEWKNRK